MKSFFKVILTITIIFYLILYFSYRNGYYIDKNKEKSLLTEAMIKEYEEDLKNGVDVTEKEYIVKEEDYDNKYTRASLKKKKKIEKVFDKMIKHFFKRIGDTINE